MTAVQPSAPSSGPVFILIDDFGQGGAQRQIALMVREFVRRGRKVIVARYAERDFLGAEIACAGAEVIRLEGGGRLSWMRSLTRLVRDRRPAVICAFLIGPATLTLLSDRLTRLGCPIVVCERVTDPDGPVNLKRRLSFALYRRAAAVVCNSMRQEDWLGRTCPALRDRIRYVGNAVDLDVFEFVPAPQRPVRRVLVLGRVVPAKGVGVLARALDVLRARSDGVELPSVAWHGQQYADGAALCASAGATGMEIDFLAPVKDVPALIRSADAVLLPSLSGEGTPNVILEAMAVGRVVIATDVGDSARLVEDGRTGWIAPPNDPIGLAQALCAALAASGEDISRMAHAGRSRVELIASIGGIIDEYETLFDKIGVESK